MTTEFKGIQLKRSSTALAVPEATQIVEGELAINLVDKKLYSKYGSTVFQVLGGVATNSIDYAMLKTATVTSLTQAALQAVYPVGSIYINAGVATNPSTLLGFGTWTEFGAGKVIVGLDSTDTLFDTLEETGGSKNATLVSHTHSATVTDPGHLHNMEKYNKRAPDANYGTEVIAPAGHGSYVGTYPTAAATTGITVSNSTEGSSATNANVQPYIVVKMWKRTA
jgi:hypothetical protein